MNRVVTRQIFSAVIVGFIGVLFVGTHQAFAASTTILPSPNIGSYSKPFTINMVVDGHGDKFNAAESTVKISSNLSIQDLTLGNCNFSFLHTPTVQNPSFAGVIISTYSTKCTVYSLTLAPKEKGKASITLSKASVKRFGDAANVLSSTYNGSYTLTGVAYTSTGQNNQMVNTSGQGLYTLYLKVYSSGTTPVSNASVTLNTVPAKNKQQGTTDNTGTAHFSNLQAGVYDAVVTEGLSKVGETIVNVSGQNHVLSLSIDLSAQKNNPLLKLGSILNYLAANPLFLVGALVVGIIIGVGVALLIIKLVWKKKVKS